MGEVMKKYVNGQYIELTPEEIAALEASLPYPPTPSEQRESAYNTQPCVEWDSELLTVTEAAQKWAYYAAEGSAKADELRTLIAEAKQSIREQYPDSE